MPTRSEFLARRRLALRTLLDSGRDLRSYREIRVALKEMGEPVAKHNNSLLADLAAIGAGKVSGRYMILPHTVNEQLVFLLQDRMGVLVTDIQLSHEQKVIHIQCVLGGGPLIYYPLRELNHPLIRSIMYTDSDLVIYPVDGKLSVLYGSMLSLRKAVTHDDEFEDFESDAEEA